MSIENQHSKPSILRKAGRIINKTRLILANLVFVGIIIFLIVALKQPRIPAPEFGSLLIFNPSGRIVLRYSQSPLQQALEQWEGQGPSEVLLHELLYTLKEAAVDDHIEGLLINLDGLAPSGMAMMEELDRGIEEFAESGKALYGYASYLSREAFPIYARLDNLTVDPFVFVQGLGYSTSRLFMAKGLDQWGIKAHIYRAGEYKSFTDVYTDEELSPAARNEMKRWLGGLWDEYRSRMQSRLSWDKGDFDQWVENIAEELSAHQGDWAALLVDRNWAKESMTWDKYEESIDMEYFFKTIDYANYSAHILPQIKQPSRQIALLPLAGEIQYGEGNWKSIGSESVLRTLDMIQNNSDIEGLVLWVDSPGGSAFASEEIHRKLMAIKDSGIPIVMVMNNTAASGAYWLATAADRIYVSPSTITGSIGVFSLSFSAGDFLEQQLGMKADGYSTTAWSERGSLISGPSKEAAEMNQSEVQFIYNEFLNRVSAARGLTIDQLENLAGGRIWTGREAVANGLADEIGSLDEALSWISTKTGLNADDAGYVLYQESLGTQVPNTRIGIKTLELLSGRQPDLVESLLQQTVEDNRAFNDPRGIAAYWSW